MEQGVEDAPDFVNKNSGKNGSVLLQLGPS